MTRRIRIHRRSKRPHSEPSEWAVTSQKTLLLGLSTVSAELLVVALLLLALPGDPANWMTGFGDSVQSPVVVSLALAICTSWLLWCIRTWAFRVRRRGPGPILVAAIEDATLQEDFATGTGRQTPPSTDGAGCAPAPIGRLAMHLRQRLSELKLSAAGPLPGRPPATDFVELLGTSDLDFKQPLAVIGKLLRLVIPTHAYEVKPTVLRRDAEPCFGIAVEFTVLPNRTTAFRTYWAESWEAAVDHAVSGIGALVIPLSRFSERGPWCAWRGKALNETMFYAYQRFERLARENRHEEALEALFAALRHDPTNDYIRLQLGQLQEELALYLDALLTYYSIRQGLHERISVASDKWERRAFERVELLARYRATTLLGSGERLAEQWLPAPRDRSPSRRALELQEIRAKLRPILIRQFGSLTSLTASDRQLLGVSDDGERGLTDLLGEKPHRLVERDGKSLGKRVNAAGTLRPLQPDERRRLIRDVEKRQNEDRRVRLGQLRLLFQFMAVREVGEFVEVYTDKDLKRLETGITPLGLRLLPSWAQVRADRARHLLQVNAGGGSHEVKGESASKDTDWPPRAEDIRALLRRVSGVDTKAGLRRSREFMDHYTVACTFAVGLLQERYEKRLGGPRVRALAEASVDSLESAVRLASREQVAAQWDWIVSEDPDLAGLRAEPEFRRFESERFPSSTGSPVRPSDIVTVVASRHSALIAREFAARLETQWHVRAHVAGPTNAHEALAWWKEELNHWRLARELSLHHRHWQTRLEVIRTMQVFCTRNGLPEFDASQRPYADDQIDSDLQGIDRAARRELSYSDDRMGALHRRLGVDGFRHPFNSWHRHFEALDAAGRDLEEGRRRRLATNRASAWADLRIAFSTRLQGESDLEAAKVAIAAAADRLSSLSPPEMAPNIGLITRSSRAAPPSSG